MSVKNTLFFRRKHWPRLVSHNKTPEFITVQQVRALQTNVLRHAVDSTAFTLPALLATVDYHATGGGQPGDTRLNQALSVISAGGWAGIGAYLAHRLKSIGKHSTSAG